MHGRHPWELRMTKLAEAPQPNAVMAVCHIELPPQAPSFVPWPHPAVCFNKNCLSKVLTLLSTVQKLSREEFRRQKDLDAARKAGTAPAALDEEGRAINPHIPRRRSTRGLP